MFKKIIAELNGIRLECNALTKSVRMASEAFQDQPRYDDEGAAMADLQRQISALAGTLDATLVKADAVRAAARASEERSRGHMKRAEASEAFVRSRDEGEETDPFESYGRAFSGGFSTGDGPGSETLPPMPGGVAPNGEVAPDARSIKRGLR